MPGAPDLEALQHAWEAAWPDALACWSRFTRLGAPRWCRNEAEEKRERLTGSFAMIRLEGHAVVVSLRQVAALGLAEHATEILAHEVGHHVYAPADLTDNARLQARIRAGLPTRENLTGFVANLYTDLLINDRLQRSAGLDMAGVYKALKPEKADVLWKLYMAMYEALWNLPPRSLATGRRNPRLQSDAQLGARVIRVYARDWLGGAGRFAALCLPYLLKIPQQKVRLVFTPWLDAEAAGTGDTIPDGLAEIEGEEEDGVLHPAADDALTGLGDGGRPKADPPPENDAEHPGAEDQATTRGGTKNRYRDPTDYVDLMKSVGVNVDEKDLIIRYYRERALPHLIPFPCQRLPESQDPLPEGLDVWEPGAPLSRIDWVESVVRSPHIIPGVTTVERQYGATAGGDPETRPVDLYLGVDCSGSMTNPAYALSYPVLAGAITVLSALRAGARSMVCLSGAPGRHSETDGFVRDEDAVLGILTGYLGTGYAFGIKRLEATFLKERPRRKTHILIVTDSDIFHMLKEVRAGWDLTQAAAAAAGSGISFVLNIPDSGWCAEDIQHLRAIGADVYLVSTEEELVAFAEAFSHATWGQQKE